VAIRAARLAAAVALLPSASVVSAQRVLVRAIEAETRHSIPGAIVVLLDSAGRRVTQGLTNEAGRLVLGAPLPGRFRLRADRIGHPGVSSDVFTVGDTITVTLMMPLARIDLPQLTVLASTQCVSRGHGEQTAGLWDEIRKALLASDITATTEAVELSVRRFRQSRTLTGALEWDSTITEQRIRGSPFFAADPRSLSSEGYIRQIEGRWNFFGPDARSLLSDDFLVDHCLEMAASPNEPSLVGLGFRPVPGRKLPEVRGVLWVDRASAELRRLDFEFVNVPPALAAPGLGGRVEFERLQSGAWIIRDWYLRSPEQVVLQPRWQELPGRTRTVVVGYLDEGGVARAIGNPTLRLTEVAARLREETVEMSDLVLRLISPQGRPIAGATVLVAELDSSLTTGADGAIRLPDIPVGRLRARVLAVGYHPLGIGLELRSGRRLLDTTIGLRRAAQPLDSIVVAGRAAEFRAGKMEDFERRRALGFGKFLTRAELHDPLRGGLDLQFRRFARIKLVPCGLGYAAAAWDRLAGPSGGHCKTDACFMTVYLDGALYWSDDMPVPPPDLSKFNPLTLEAAEVYRSPAEMPIEYGGTGSLCGVILLWTRTG